jgi:hypothetical protein
VQRIGWKADQTGVVAHVTKSKMSTQLHAHTSKLHTSHMLSRGLLVTALVGMTDRLVLRITLNTAIRAIHIECCFAQVVPPSIPSTLRNVQTMSHVHSLRSLVLTDGSKPSVKQTGPRGVVIEASLEGRCKC